MEAKRRKSLSASMRSCADVHMEVRIMSIQPKSDYSFLFSGLGSGAANVAGSNFLSDYASIKNGSYGKLMKAYYSESGSDSVKSLAKNSSINKKNNSKSQKLTTEESKAYAKVQTSTDALKDSADALLSKSLFQQKDITVKNEDGTESVVKEYDTDAIYKAVNSFVTNYNSVVNAVDKTDSSSVTTRAGRMINDSASNLKALLAVGISINADSTLSLDKDAFMKADMSKVKSLFNGSGSYGYRVSAQASLINYAADREVSKGSFYSTTGSYNTSFTSGNLFNNYL